MQGMPSGLSPAEQGAWARLVAYHIAPEPDWTLRAITELGPYQERDFWRRVDTWHRPEGSAWSWVGDCLVSAVRAWPDDPDGLAQVEERGSSAEDARVEGEVGDTTPAPTGAPSTAPSITVRPMPRPRPLTLAEAAGVVAGQLAGALRRRARRGGAR